MIVIRWRDSHSADPIQNQRFNLQKREVLSDPKLPAEFRLALARSLQDDLFCQARIRSLHS